MGSYDYDTQRTNPAGVGHKNNHAATEVAETEEVKHLKSQYKNELTKLQELFPNWSEADLLFALQEGQGALEHTIDLITDGFVTQWGEVKSRKSKKEHGSKSKQGVQQPGNTQRGQRGDRGRARGEGGRGGRGTRGQRRDNRPPRQQNGTNSSNYDDTNNVTHGKARGTENTSSFRNNNNDSIGGNWNNNTNEGTNTWATDSDWSTDITGQGSSWSAENPAENVKGNWANDNTDKPQGSWNKENPTDTSKTGRNVDNTQQNVKGSWAADNSTENNKDGWVTDISTDNNIMASRDIDKATDSLKHNRDSNITKDNWDTDKDNWGVENDNLTADTSKDNWSSDTTKNGKSVKEVSRSPNAVMRSVAPTKSPVSHNLRTISPKSTTSWAQIVKPESKPEPKPEPISVPIHKNSEIVKPLSPNPVQSPPAPKVTESVVVPSQELLTTSSVVTTSVSDEIEEYVRETSPEASSTSATTSATVINASPSTKEVSPPGLHKAKAGTNTRRLKQDDAAPVVMPSTGAGLERVGVQFGSLSISNNTVEESSETETQIVPQLQNTEERSVETSPQLETSPIQQQQQIVQQQAVQQLQQQQQVSQQVAQQQATQQLQQAAQQLQQPPQSSQPQSSTLSQPNPINRHPTTSTQILPSSVGSAPTGTPANAPNPTPQNFNPSYFKQQQDQSSAAYLNQQHHLGLAAEPLNGPYTSYLPNQHQPPNQISGFGIGPMQSLPAEYNAMYSPDAQRMMGYYAADPTYGQASPVTSTGYQGRDNKYTSDTATNTNSQTTNQQSTGTHQSTNQQGGQNPQQQQAYPLGVPYYPYYYMTNQFPSAAYQQSGYGQPFKSMYPMYNHPHSSKPGSVSGASPYYPTTPTTPSTPHYSHTSNTGYEEVSGAQIHHHPVPSVLDYQKPYGSMPPLNFLGNAGSNNPQPASNANSNVSGGKSNNSNGGSELNPPTQYKSYQDKSTNAQPTGGIGQSGTQHQQPPTNPNYYGQQFNNYQHPQTHHQYYQHQAHHQATNRNQQYWTSQS